MGVKDDSGKPVTLTATWVEKYPEATMDAVKERLEGLMGKELDGSPLTKAISNAISSVHLANLDISINGIVTDNTSCDILRLVSAVEQLRLSAILTELEAGVPCMVVAKHFGITPSRVSQIKREDRIVTNEIGEE